MKATKSNMPRAVARRIMKRAANGERAVVVVIRKGKPSRVFGFDEYQKRKVLTQEVKPWEHRKPRSGADPLGAVDGTVVKSLTREEIYE